MSNPRRHVVVAFDASPPSLPALDRAIELACRAPQHILHFVVVIDARTGTPMLPPTEGVDYRYAGNVQELVSQTVQGMLAQHNAEATVHFFVHARLGDPAEEILQQAREVGADLIVIGSHGYRGLRRTLLGSVAEQVMRAAECAVIVARPKRYADVALPLMTEVERSPKPYVPPHRYSYENHLVAMRPLDWPLY